MTSTGLETVTSRLLDRFFDYVKQSPELDWNPKLSFNGDTRSKRRMRAEVEVNRKKSFKLFLRVM